MLFLTIVSLSISAEINKKDYYQTLMTWCKNHKDSRIQSMMIDFSGNGVFLEKALKEQSSDQSDDGVLEFIKTEEGCRTASALCDQLEQKEAQKLQEIVDSIKEMALFVIHQ